MGQDKGSGIEELGCLSNLKGVVKIYGLEHVTSREDAEQANLLGNPNIYELKFYWCGERKRESALHTW